MKTISADILLDENMIPTLKKETFLANTNNKQRLISMIIAKLHSRRITWRQATEDADTVIVNEALSLAEGNGTLLDLSPQCLRKKFICGKHSTELRTDSGALPIGAIPIHYSTVEEFTEEELNIYISQLSISSPSIHSSGSNNLLVQPSCCSNIGHYEKNNSDNENEDHDLLAELQNLPLYSIERRKR
ncbi:hypothetical protein JTB14_003121 [Gonioctena quinquepunctata]|nr:hypothetical protein JTB14_003121 [Gonioctena quinquepunctata]